MAAKPPADNIVRVEPYQRNGDYLVAGFMDARGLSVTDREYHAVRDKIMEMRSRDPEAGRMFDKFLTADAKKTTLPPAEMKALGERLGKNGLALGSLTNEIAADLKRHDYHPGYRPQIMVSVDQRPMIPSQVVSQLDRSGVVGSFSDKYGFAVQRSEAPGKITGSEINFHAKETNKLLPHPETSRFGFSTAETGEKLMKASLVDHVRWKGLLKGLAGVGATVVAVASKAAEPGATPMMVVDAGINTQVPGWSQARDGKLCKAFGEAAGVAAGTWAMYAATPVVATAAVGVTVASGPAAPVVGTLAAVGATAAVAGAGALTTAAVSPAVETTCNAAKTAINYVTQKMGL